MWHSRSSLQQSAARLRILSYPLSTSHYPLIEWTHGAGAPNTSGGYMAQVKITVRDNGPLRVEAPEGSIELVDADGKPYDLTGKTAFSLCRCGGSVNKPFCDGTHSRIGFQAAESAVKAADENKTLISEPLPNWE